MNLIILFFVVFIGSGVYIYLLFEDVSAWQALTFASVLSIVMTVLTSFWKRSMNRDLDVTIPHQFWRPGKSTTFSCSGNRNDIIDRTVNGLSHRKDVWSVEKVDKSTGVLLLRTSPIAWKLSTISEKEVRVFFDDSAKRVTITSEPSTKTGIFRELIDYGKDYQNVQFIKRIIEGEK